MSYEFSVGCCSLFAVLSGSDPLNLDHFFDALGADLPCLVSTRRTIIVVFVVIMPP
ncbi:hypothetical protein SynRS9902_01244 [Synechococcus sp. RS9902]|nr:hypothetical protein SynRS9902_01244 [Synechococcus sp. RS9902]